MQRIFRKSRELRFEALERRAMLAGDVTVSIVNHDLVVHSDDGDDSITITQPTAGTIQVEGLSGTTINGQSAVFTAQGVNNISVVMGAGNDSVTVQGGPPPVVPFNIVGGIQYSTLFQNMAIAGNLSVVAGAGTDNVAISYANIAGGLSVSAGNGNDTVNLLSVHVSNDADIQLGNGNDTVSIAGLPAYKFAPTPLNSALTVIYPLQPVKVVPVTPSPVTPTTFSRQMSIDGDLTVSVGQGQDGILINAATISGNVTLTGQGGDVVTVGQDSFLTLPVGGIQFDHIVTGNDVSIGETLTILTGNGSSQISLDGAQAQSIVITTGAGNDTILMTRTIADAFFASLGAGDDTLDTSGGANTITSLVAFGGGGNDTFLSNASNSFKHQFLFLFEHIS